MWTTFLVSACDFLHCRIESLLFKYLGILVGANPMLEYTCKNTHDNLDGWVILLILYLMLSQYFFGVFFKDICEGSKEAF